MIKNLFPLRIDFSSSILNKRGESLYPFFLSALTTITFTIFSIYISIYFKGELKSENLGLNEKRERWSFLKSNREITFNLKEFHDAYLSRIIIGIGTLTLFIIGILYITKQTSINITSNFSVELRWIIFPIIVLTMIGIPSVELIYQIEDGEKREDFTFKRTGFQWFWAYENSLNSFDSYIAGDQDSDSPLYLRSSDKISLPIFSSIQNVVTSGDVIHSWALPSVIIKIDAIPGRINSLQFSLPYLENSLLFGQCSELCGVNHRFIPIVVEAKLI